MCQDGSIVGAWGAFWYLLPPLQIQGNFRTSLKGQITGAQFKSLCELAQIGPQAPQLRETDGIQHSSENDVEEDGGDSSRRGRRGRNRSNKSKGQSSGELGEEKKTGSNTIDGSKSCNVINGPQPNNDRSNNPCIASCVTRATWLSKASCCQKPS